VAAADLVTLEQTREYLQRVTQDTDQDPTIEGLITRLSVAISRHCGRQFAPAEDSATHRLRLKPDSHLDGLYVLDLAPYDLRQATTVQLHPETTSPVTLTAGVDYTTEPANPRDGIFTSLSLYPLRIAWTSTAAMNFGYANIDVTGAWGFTEVPGPVQQACISGVALYLRSEATPFGGALQPNSIGEGVNREVLLPPGLRALLSPYVRTPIF
jgi:hypothetical protein